MIQQASRVDVLANSNYLAQQNYDTVTSPVVHDSVGVSYGGGLLTFGTRRKFKYLNGSDQVQQHEWWRSSDISENYGMDYQQSKIFYDTRYRKNICQAKRSPMQPVCSERNGQDADGSYTLLGAVEGKAYSLWLHDNYNLNIEINQSDFQNGRPVAGSP